MLMILTLFKDCYILSFFKNEVPDLLVSGYSLDSETVNFLCKEPDSKYYKLCGPVVCDATLHCNDIVKVSTDHTQTSEHVWL